MRTMIERTTDRRWTTPEQDTPRILGQAAPHRWAGTGALPPPLPADWDVPTDDDQPPPPRRRHFTLAAA